MDTQQAQFINKFGMSDVEAQYRSSRRLNSVAPMRRLFLISAIILLMYVLLNPLFLPQRSVGEFTEWLTPLAIVLGAAAFFCGTKYYIRYAICDLLIFLSISAPMIGICDALAAQPETTGWAFQNTFSYNCILVLVCSCFSFVASFRTFVLWTIVQSIYFLSVLIFKRFDLTHIVYCATTYFPILAVVLFTNWSLDADARRIFDLNSKLESEKEKTEDLLYNVLPREVALRIQSGSIVADAFSDVTIVFIDIVGFSTLAKSLSPGHTVELLNRFFGISDRLAEQFEMEKVKTIGDAYLAVCGAMTKPNAPALNSIAFSKALIAELGELSALIGFDVSVRIGIHSGPVVGGVISSKRMSYDYWGDAMNIASRIQSVAGLNRVVVSESTFLATKRSVQFGPPRTVPLKGIGEVTLYDLMMDQE